MLASAKRQFINPVEVEYMRRVVVGALVFKLGLVDVEQRIEVRLPDAAGVSECLLERVVCLQFQTLRESPAYLCL